MSIFCKQNVSYKSGCFFRIRACFQSLSNVSTNLKTFCIIIVVSISDAQWEAVPFLWQPRLLLWNAETVYTRCFLSQQGGSFICPIIKLLTDCFYSVWRLSGLLETKYRNATHCVTLVTVSEQLGNCKKQWSTIISWVYYYLNLTVGDVYIIFVSGVGREGAPPSF